MSEGKQKKINRMTFEMNFEGRKNGEEAKGNNERDKSVGIHIYLLLNATTVHKTLHPRHLKNAVHSFIRSMYKRNKNVEVFIVVLAEGIWEWKSRFVKIFKVL